MPPTVVSPRKNTQIYFLIKKKMSKRIFHTDYFTYGRRMVPNLFGRMKISLFVSSKNIIGQKWWVMFIYKRRNTIWTLWNDAFAQHDVYFAKLVKACLVALCLYWAIVSGPNNWQECARKICCLFAFFCRCPEK